MADIVRFGVSIPRPLLKSFDQLITGKEYPNRSEAIRDLIRDNLVKQEWNPEPRPWGPLRLSIIIIPESFPRF